MQMERDQIEIENILHHLNYRWNIEVLAQWEGARIPFKPYQIYDGYEIFISHDTLERIDKLKISLPEHDSNTLSLTISSSDHSFPMKSK